MHNETERYRDTTDGLISTGNLPVFAFFLKFYNNGDNQKLKDWFFQLRKNYFCIFNIERLRAHQISITFFCTPIACIPN